MHRDSALPDWIITCFPVVFVIGWCCVNFLVSLGWAGLAKVYRARESPVGGVCFRGCAGVVSGNGSGHYKGILKVTLMGTGIHVVPMLIFRLFHPPLLLPWRGVQSLTEESRLFAFRRTQIQFADQEGNRILLIIPAAALANVLEVSGRNDLSPLPSGRDIP